MPTPIYTPRINNNDDEVRLAAVLVDIGSRIRAGDPVIDVETDKATFTVESTGDGYLIGVAGNVGDTLAVGSVLAWIGATADEKIAAERPAEAAGAENQSPTLKALLLLKQYGLREDEVPRAGGRLTAEEVQQYANSHRRGGPVSAEWSPPMVAGHIEPFTPEQKEIEIEADGLLAVVLQHEIDHLDGKLFIDRISRIKRELYRRKLQKALKEGKTDGERPSGARL